MKKYRPAVYFDGKEEETIKVAVLFGKEKNINEFCRKAILEKAEKIKEKNLSK